MPTPRVVDLSHHNVVPKDFMATKAAGVVGIIHKLTEGSSYVDSDVDARYYLAKQAGLAWGVYHFLRPGDMKQQAEFFVNKAISLKVCDNDTLYVADHEDATVSVDQLKVFLDYVENLTGHEPVVYSGHVLKDQCQGSSYKFDRKLWLCHYTTGTPTLPDGCNEYWLWQYTDKGTIAGINPPTDLNHFEGDSMEFLKGWSGRKEEPIPEELVPGVAIVNIDITSPSGVEVKVTVNGTTL